MTTHDYTTRKVLAKNLTKNHVLVGECGGLSAVFDVFPSEGFTGYLIMDTEHGHMLTRPSKEFNVIDFGIQDN